MTEDTLRWWVDHALLLYIVVILTMKALILRRESRLGAALAVNNLMFALLYLGAFLAFWYEDFFRSVWWAWFVRVGVAITATGVLVEFRHAFGGWGPLLHEVRKGLTVRGRRDDE